MMGRSLRQAAEDPAAREVRRARELTEVIRATATTCWELIAEAYASRAWSTLGYGSWDDYRSHELNGLHLQMPAEDRQTIVASLREAGLSLRAISAVTGVSKDTVARSLPTVSNETVDDDPEPTPIIGMNGKRYDSTRKPRIQPSEDDELVSNWAALLRQIRERWIYMEEFSTSRLRNRIIEALDIDDCMFVLDMEKRIDGWDTSPGGERNRTPGSRMVVEATATDVSERS